MSLDLNRPRRRSHGAPSLHRHSAVGSIEASSEPKLQSCLHPWPWDARAVVRFGPSAASEPSTAQGVGIPSHSGGPAAPRENEVLACSTAAGVQRRSEADGRVWSILAGVERSSQTAGYQGGQRTVQVSSLPMWIHKDRQRQATFSSLHRLERQPRLRFLGTYVPEPIFPIWYSDRVIKTCFGSKRDRSAPSSRLPTPTSTSIKQR